MKKCEHCNGDIEDDAKLCIQCGRMVGMKPKEKWYFKTSSLVVSFLCIGPFALPFLWLNPRFSRRSKIIVSSLVIIVSYYLLAATVRSTQGLMQYFEQLNKTDF